MLITGVAGEIGTAIAELYNKNGFVVIGVDSIQTSSKFVDQYIQQDICELLTQPSAKENFSNTLMTIVDANPLKALVNNAALQIVKPAIDCTYEDQLNTFQTNLFAPHVLVQICCEALRKSKGSIINVASVHASATKKDFSLYAASKAALISLTRSLAIELGPEVRVNSISPAAIDTKMLVEGLGGDKQLLSQLNDCHISGRIGHPNEIAELIYFLTSDKSGFITGCDYPIDGGVLSKLLDPGN